MHMITFLRHAESERNAQQVLQGKTDTPLTARGNEQAQQLAVIWKANGVSFIHVTYLAVRRQWNFFGFTSPAQWAGKLPENKGPL